MSDWRYIEAFERENMYEDNKVRVTPIPQTDGDKFVAFAKELFIDHKVSMEVVEMVWPAVSEDENPVAEALILLKGMKW